jgi:hypothetical protein
MNTAIFERAYSAAQQSHDIQQDWGISPVLLVELLGATTRVRLIENTKLEIQIDMWVRKDLPTDILLETLAIFTSLPNLNWMRHNDNCAVSILQEQHMGVPHYKFTGTYSKYAVQTNIGEQNTRKFPKIGL